MIERAAMRRLDPVASKQRARLDRQFDRLGRRIPASAGFFRWIRKPSSRLLRIPVALLLIAGGVFSFLPILGLWMLPLGVLLLALDLAFLQGPVNHAVLRLQRRWSLWRRRRRARSTAR